LPRLGAGGSASERSNESSGCMKCWNFSTSWRSLSFLGRTLVHGFS
jgi:hypothetical protein